MATEFASRAAVTKRPRGPIAQALHFDFEVFVCEARRAGEQGDVARREELGAEAVRRWCRYSDHLAHFGIAS